MKFFPLVVVLALAVLLPAASLAQKKLVIFDQDTVGPGGTGMGSLLLAALSPDLQVMGVTVMTGDGWRDAETAHALRLLELVGRTDIPVVPGATFPLVRTQDWTEQWERSFGKVYYKGAWNDPNRQRAGEVPALQEGNPQTKPSSETAAGFLVRMVREHPHQIWIFAGGPFTNLALAISLYPEFAEQTAGLIFMGGSLNPKTERPEFVDNPRREFNFWFDPEAAHIVLRAKWPVMVGTTVDLSVQRRFAFNSLKAIGQCSTPAARYVQKYEFKPRHFWDELAVATWIKPELIRAERNLYLDVNLDRGPGYGETIVVPNEVGQKLGLTKVRVPTDVDWAGFEQLLVDTLCSPSSEVQPPPAQR